MARIASLILFIIALAGCGVRIEIAERPQPTPTARPWWRLYNTGEGVTRTLAAPVIVFGEAVQPRAALFTRDLPDKTFLLQYHQLWLPIEYDVTWFAAGQSAAYVRLNVYTRADEGDEWQLYDRAEHPLITDSTPSHNRDTLGIGLYAEVKGSFDVRAEIGVSANQTNGETSTLVETREFRVRVLSEPDDVTVDDGALVPVLQMPDDLLLPDWRAWRGGPCALAERAQASEAAAPLSAACDAFNAGDYWRIFEQLDGVEIADSSLSADTYGAAGLLLLSMGEPGLAADAFRAAEMASDAADNAVDLAIHIYNLGVAQAASGDLDAAYVSFACAGELRGQFWDEVGYIHLRASGGYLQRDYGAVEEAYWFFENRGLAQADTLERWLFQIEQGIE